MESSMKRFLVVSGSVILVLSPITAVVSCSVPQKQDQDLDKLIGLDVDKSQAINDSNNTGPFTNFYTIGDSLSDVGGLTSILTSVLNKPVSFSGISHNSSFSNGDVAAVKLANKLNISNFNSGFNYKLGQNTYNKFGKNYSVEGATAATANGTMGAIVNKFKIQDQAETVIKQHKVKSTDLVFLEIGGNDLFGMIGSSEANKAVKMEEAINNIKKAMLTLLNNGLRNIIVMNAPDVSKIPTYSSQSAEIQKEASDLSKEFNDRFEIVFDEVNYKYGNPMQMYDLGTRFNEMLDEFVKEKAAEGKTGNILDLSITIKMDLDEIMKTGQIKVDYNEGVTEETINDYFFYDAVHPNQ
jgi:phospholipase/lecithinase/hemolysin